MIKKFIDWLHALTPGSLFVIRLTAAWAAAMTIVFLIFLKLTSGNGPSRLPWFLWIAATVVIAAVASRSYSHTQRVRLIAGRVDADMLSNRQRRQIEIPLPADEAFGIVEAAVRELPGVADMETSRDSFQLRARIERPASYEPRPRFRWQRPSANRITAIVAPGDSSGSVTLICEPVSGAWDDWFSVDDCTNLENAEAVTRAITRRVAERRRVERAEAHQTETEKELTAAKLGLLQAQVEPHFLYNTLASAQLLTRSDPAKADEMLGRLIAYLRTSLPRTDESLSTLGAEVERSRAYLDVLKIRMGSRLNVVVDVPPALEPLPFPPMMLQTLVENAIKHGLEPKPGGGTIWLKASATKDRATISVADDGMGLATDGGGSGIGLRNVRERLRLAYGDTAALVVAANFPAGVTASIALPNALAQPREAS